MTRIEVDAEALDAQIRELEANCASFMEFAEDVIPPPLAESTGGTASTADATAVELRNLLAQADLLFHSSVSVLSAARGIYIDADQSLAGRFGQMG
jgi:hypothetical protein